MSNQPTNILQAKCEAAATDVLDIIQHRAPVTLIAFYNNGHSEGLGYYSSLPLDHVITTLEARVVRWCGAPAPLHEAADWLPSREELSKLADHVRARLPFSAAFSLIVGAGPDHAHASFVRKEDLLPLFHETVIPQLKARQMVAAQLEQSNAG